MLGRSWRRLLDEQRINYTAPSSRQLDLTQALSIKHHLEKHPRVILNCAAWTDVDGAETNSALADQLNGSAVGELAKQCEAIEATLVHYSSDYVFPGSGSRPYQVQDPKMPSNAYGRSKWQGEISINQSHSRFLLIRTSWLYAPWGKNFVRSIASRAQQQDQLKVVNDQRGRPTSTDHLAHCTLRLLERSAVGTYHVTDGGDCTWYDFASEIVRHINPSCCVEPCTSNQYPRPAKRPAYSVLDLSQTEAAIGPMPHWKTNLADVLQRLEPLCESS